jgi:hypothetical protein
VGHVSRAFETAGIPTVIIASKAFRAKLETMSLSRVVLTSNIMGRSIGIPGDVAGQNKVLQAALDLLDSASALNSIVAL